MGDKGSNLGELGGIVRGEGGRGAEPDSRIRGTMKRGV